MLSFLFMVIITSFVPTSIPTWKYDFSTLWKGNPSLYELIGLVPNMYSGDIHLCSPLFKQFFSTCSKCFHPIFLLNFWTYISILLKKHLFRPTVGKTIGTTGGAPSVMQDDCFLRLKIHKCRGLSRNVWTEWVGLENNGGFRKRWVYYLFKWLC